VSKWARLTPELTGVKKIRAVSVDAALFPHVGDAITVLTNDSQWEKVGNDVSDIVASCKESVESWYSDMLIGAVFPWIINPPAGWLLLDGATYASVDYPELSSLLPSHLIDGDDFVLPDVENAFPFGVLNEDNVLAVTGSNVLNLTVGQLPAHTHTEIPPIVGVQVGGAGPPLPSSVVGAPIASGSTGDGDAIDTRPQRFGLVYAVFSGRG
jgi:hypothetical protein